MGVQGNFTLNNKNKNEAAGNLRGNTQKVKKHVPESVFNLFKP
jgi:hypothetical protein